MTQQVEGLAAKPDKLRLMVGTHVVEGERQLKQSSDLHMCIIVLYIHTCMCARAQTHTHTLQLKFKTKPKTGLGIKSPCYSSWGQEFSSQYPCQAAHNCLLLQLSEI